MQSWSSGYPERASSMCCPQPVQVTFPQDEHEAGEHILISYISSDLPRNSVYPGGYRGQIATAIDSRMRKAAGHLVPGTFH